MSEFYDWYTDQQTNDTAHDGECLTNNEEEANEKFADMLNNLAMVMRAAKETSEGTVTFFQALRLGGFFGKAN
jgi:hypothetical protein